MKRESGTKGGKQGRKNWQERVIASLISVSLVATNAWSAPTITISQVPLALITPSRPQVLIALANSQSMDGTLSGAILTGSGQLASRFSSLYSSSSPVNYLVPNGFTPPVQGANASGQAPYTVSANGRLVDNGPSRLNVAKNAIEAILQAYLDTTDFALESYNVSNASSYNTWVYYMSPAGSNFQFTNFPFPNRYVNNPCFAYPLASSTVQSNCASMASLFGGTTLATSLYMVIGASSDDANISDVLYANPSLPGIFTSFGGPTPASPYPPSFSLTNYNNGAVSLRYTSSNPSSVRSLSLTPTNAGFVPFSPQVMFAQRGFGYAGTQSATSGRINVTMTNLGSSPTTTAINNAYNLFVPLLNPETNNASTPEIESSAGQSPMGGLLATAQTYLNSLVYSGSGCPPQKYVILISDGLPTQDLSGKLWPPLGSAAAAGYGVTATFNADGSLNSTNNQAVTDTITRLTALSQAGIITYVIGLGAGVDPTINPQAAATLTAMAIAGGSVNYYPATSSDALVSNLNSILQGIQNGSYSVSAASVNSTQLQTGTVEYQATFTASDTPYGDWTGDLVEKTLDALTGTPSASNVWSAQPLLDAKASGNGWNTNRLIVTWNPTTVDGVPFTWNKISASQQALLQPSDSQGSNRLQYLRGSTALEVRNGGSFRNRSHILGDIMSSQGAYVGSPSGSYFAIPSYATFVSTYSNRAPVVYVGANDGMLHAFDAETGNELFAFIPNGVFKNLSRLSLTTYNQSHLYFVDGSPHFGDVQFSDLSWHTLLVGGEGGGGNSIYSLDITTATPGNSETQLATRVLWEFTDTDMGLSYSEPVIAPINPSTSTSQTFAVFFGNGYNSPNNNSVLYAVNPQTGAVLRKINFCTIVPSACNSTLVQGLSSVAVGTQDGIQGVPITQVYAGDLQGNLWAVDVTNSNPAQWTPRLLFQARDATGAIQPITTTPAVTLHPLYPRLQGLFIMFTTGRFLSSSDLTSTQTQSVYGVWDKLPASGSSTRSNLQVQTLSIVRTAVSGLAQDIMTATANSVTWANKLGWFADMPVAGQRAVSDPQLLNGAFIATLITPPANICLATFTSMLMELNYQTGGAFYYPQLDINGSGTITSSDNYNGAYPVGIGLGSGYVSAPTILGANANNNRVKLFTQGSGSQFTVLNPNNIPRIMSWWQTQ